MELVEQLITGLQKISGDNQFLTGGIAVWAMSVLTYLMRSIPMSVLRWLDRRFIARMTFDNSSWELRDLQHKFDAWYSTTKWIAAVRDFRLMSTCDGRTILSPGGSVNFFRIGWRFYWFTTTKDSQERMMMETVYITHVATFSLWASNKTFEAFVAMFSAKFDSNEEQSLYRVMGEDNRQWTTSYRATRRNWNHFAFNRTVRGEVTRAVDNFLTKKDLYTRLGLRHKHTFMFYGEPGTGKTGLADIIAGITGFDVYPLSMEGKCTKDFVWMLKTIPSNSILLLEDIDSFIASRDAMEPEPVLTGADDDEPWITEAVDKINGKTPKRVDSKMSLSGLLNVLDGIAPLNDLIVVITTNVLEDLDPALYRKSRVDTLLEIPRFHSSESWDYILRLYPELRDRPLIDLKPLRACDLADLVKTHFVDSNAFYNDLVLTHASNAPDEPANTVTEFAKTHRELLQKAGIL